MLVIAMLPSGTTCPVGNVVWGVRVRYEKIRFVAHRLCNSMLDSRDGNNRDSLDLGCNICQVTLFCDRYLTYAGLTELKL